MKITLEDKNINSEATPINQADSYFRGFSEGLIKTMIGLISSAVWLLSISFLAGNSLETTTKLGLIVAGVTQCLYWSNISQEEKFAGNVHVKKHCYGCLTFLLFSILFCYISIIYPLMNQGKTLEISFGGNIAISLETIAILLYTIHFIYPLKETGTLYWRELYKNKKSGGRKNRQLAPPTSFSEIPWPKAKNDKDKNDAQIV